MSRSAKPMVLTSTTLKVGTLSPRPIASLALTPGTGALWRPVACGAEQRASTMKRPIPPKCGSVYAPATLRLCAPAEAANLTSYLSGDTLRGVVFSNCAGHHRVDGEGAHEGHSAEA